MGRRRRNETEEQRARRELISDFLSAANIQSMDDIQELFKEALAGFMEGSLESELDSELGYEPYDVKNKETDNSRNGHSKKTLRTSMGKVDIEVPRDRNGEFEPKILPMRDALMQQLCIIGQIPYRAAVVLSNLVGVKVTIIALKLYLIQFRGKNQENHEVLLKFSEYQ